MGVLPSAAAAHTTEAIADTGGMSLSLNVLGAPVVVGVTLDAFGNIIEVVITDGASGDAGFGRTRSGEHKVQFTRDSADGSTVINVKAKNSKLSVKLRTSNLSDVLGTHVWTGDIFGSGTATKVTFMIGTPNGPYAEITSVSVDDTTPAYRIDGPYTERDDDDDEDEDEYESKARITFFSEDGFKKTLKIEVETHFGDDDDDDDDHDGTYTKLKVELTGRDQSTLTGDDALGEHTWTGLLCDETPAAVTYMVSTDGVRIVENGVEVAEGVRADVDQDDDGFTVRFTDSNGDDGAYLKVELEDEHGTLELKVKSRTTTSCDDDDDDDDHDEYDDDDDDHDDDHSSSSHDDDEDEDDEDDD